MKRIYLIITIMMALPVSAWADMMADQVVKSSNGCVEYSEEQQEWRTSWVNNYSAQECVTLDYDHETHGNYNVLKTAAQPVDGWSNSQLYIYYAPNGGDATRNYYIRYYIYYVVTYPAECGSVDMDEDGYIGPCMDCDDNNAAVHADTDGDGVCDVSDSDGDGMEDDVDPLPDDARDFTWQKDCYVVAADGSCKGYKYTIIDADGEKTYSYTGQTVEECKATTGGNCYMSIQAGNSATYTSEDWATEFADYEDTINYYSNLAEVEAAATASGSGETGDTTSNINVPEYTESETATTGTGYTSGDTDSVSLGKVVDNTAAIAANQQGIMNALNKVNNSIVDSNKLLLSGSASSGGGTSSATVADGVEDGIEDAFEGVSGTISNTESDSAYNTAIETIDGEITSDEIPDEFEAKTNIEEKMDEVGTSSGVQGIKALIKGNTVTATGDCSFTWQYGTHQIVMSLCDQANTIHTIGMIMQAVCGLICILYIFGK